MPLVAPFLSVLFLAFLWLSPSAASADTPPPRVPALKPPSPTSKPTLAPPIPTRSVSAQDTYHGTVVSDPYRWLEDGHAKEVQAWGDAQHQRTTDLLKQIPQRQTILDELKRLHKTRSSTSPRVYGTKYFFFRRDGLQDQPILYLREGGHDQKERVLLDPNTLSKDGTISIQEIAPSPSGHLLAYALSAKGSDWSSVRLLHVETGEHLPDQIHETRWPTIVWDRHGLGFFYVAYPPQGSVPRQDRNYYRRIFYHRLGTPTSEDRLVFGEGLKKETWLTPSISSDRRYLFVSVSLDWSKNDLFYRPVDATGAPFLPIATGLPAQVSADTLGDQLLISTTYQAPRGRVLLAPLSDPSNPKGWKTLIPEQKAVLQAVHLVQGHLLLHFMEDVASRLALYTLDGRFLRDLPLPTKGSVSDIQTRPKSHEIFFRFTSWIYPSTGYRYDLQTHRLQATETLAIPVQLDRYETKQIFYPSKDGTKIPLFLVHRKGLRLDRSNPTELYGYGGFEVSLTPSFLPSLFPWLDRGGVFALANLRGGGEYGAAWHLAGRRDKKQKVYDDMIAAAEWLIAQGYTRPSRLAIRGGSNGGLLVAAVMAQRPSLFGAVICQVPLTDMIRYPRSTVARLWIPEYGDPQKPEEFRWLWSYSPYHRLQPRTAYPTTLVMTADHDDRVDPAHARKFAARLQASSTRPVLLRIESKAGHGAGTPISKLLESTADRYAFLLWALR